MSIGSQLNKFVTKSQFECATIFKTRISTPLKNVSRPPSSRPSPQGEGESHADSLKYLRLDLPNGYPQN